jgi:hypothetical protein
MKIIELNDKNFSTPIQESIKKLFFYLLNLFFYLLNKAKNLLHKAKKLLLKINLTLLCERHLILTYSQFIKLTKNKKEILCPKKTINILDPIIFQKERNSIVKNARTINFPEVYASIIEDTKIIGGSSLVWTKKHALIYDTINLKKNITSEELHNRIFIRDDKISSNRKKAKFIIEKGAFFCDASSSNYAHWLTEILPRIFVFISNPVYKDYQLLIDKSIAKSMLESLRMICKNRTVYLVPKDFCVKIRKMLFISEIGIVPFQTKSKSNNNNIQSVKFNKKIILEMRSHFFKLNNIKKTYSYIFIKRKSSNKKILNEDEIESYLTSLGFVSVDFSNLNFSDQINIFKNAKCIVASSGASLANMIFSEQKTKIIILIGASKLVSYFYWVNMASIVNKRISFVLGEVPISEKDSIHPNFFVPLNLLKRALNKST